MEVSKKKSKTMVNYENENASIFIDGTLLMRCPVASDNKLCIRLARAMSAMVRLDKIWNRKISLFVSNTTYTSH